MNLKKFPFFKQLDAMDCGPASLKIIAAYYGKSFSLKFLRDKSNITKEGVSLLDISKTAEEIEFKTLALKLKFDDLRFKIPLPCVIHWDYKHFVVIYKITKSKVYISDPQIGLVNYSHEDFNFAWKKGQDLGYVLVLEPTAKFSLQDNIRTSSKINEVFNYLRPHRKLLIQVFLGMVMNIGLALLFPLITQSIVDIGIFTGDISFIHMLLAASVILTFSSVISQYFQERIMLFVSDKISISMISDFIKKLLSLEIIFFERKLVSDILARIEDQTRIQGFLIETVLGLTISTLSVIVYSILLFFYSSDLLIVFFISTIFYIGWTVLFLKKRRKLDFQYFDASVDNQSNIIEIFNNIHEVKTNNLEQDKKWTWEKSRLHINMLNIKMLNINQSQGIGASLIDKIKSILLTFFAAQAVISGEMTLGMMLSVQYIIGQLNGPIGSILGFVQSAQEAKISLERVNEVMYEEKEEEIFEGLEMELPKDRSIVINDLRFRYSQNGPEILKGLNVKIAEGTVTAIVGASGSGKSTLLKVLLRFYKPTSGNIKIGSTDLSSISIEKWRNECAVVLQDGQLLSGSILYNITLSKLKPDQELLLQAVKSANLENFINELPLKFYSMVGEGGTPISGGQKQRILLARSIYKNPSYLFLDEATNALDANNESEISSNINDFAKSRTAIIIAHRLSTIKSANQILVMSKGNIAELGTHEQLLDQKGVYYDLVKNQLSN